MEEGSGGHGLDGRGMSVGWRRNLVGSANGGAEPAGMGLGGTDMGPSGTSLDCVQVGLAGTG